MKPKYERIGHNYNSTRKADPFLTRQLLKHLKPNTNGVYLDIGCGTGNYTNALAEKGYRFMGVDPSQLMLEKAKLLNSNVDWRIGTAEHTGLENAVVDGIIGSLTIHHWKDLGAAFAELKRILKPRGRIVLFTSTPEQMQGYWLNRYFPKMLRDSMVQMPNLEAVATAILGAGLVLGAIHKYFVKPDLEDQFLYCGKHYPELYFDEAVRSGISSFSDLSNKEEVAQGLAQLEIDIATGDIEDIIASYDNDLGDYLYVMAEKV